MNFRVNTFQADDAIHVFYDIQPEQVVTPCMHFVGKLMSDIA